MSHHGGVHRAHDIRSVVVRLVNPVAALAALYVVVAISISLAVVRVVREFS
jgi:hypothetical protein